MTVEDLVKIVAALIGEVMLKDKASTVMQATLIVVLFILIIIIGATCYNLLINITTFSLSFIYVG